MIKIYEYNLSAIKVPLHVSFMIWNKHIEILYFNRVNKIIDSRFNNLESVLCNPHYEQLTACFYSKNTYSYVVDYDPRLVRRMKSPLPSLSETFSRTFDLSETSWECVIGDPHEQLKTRFFQFTL